MDVKGQTTDTGWCKHWGDCYTWSSLDKVTMGMRNCWFQLRFLGIGIRNENNNLITVNPTTDKNIELANPLRYLDDISPPLLHAWEDDKLYILNL